MTTEQKTNLALYAINNAPTPRSIVGQCINYATIAYEIDDYANEVFKYIDECIEIGTEKFKKKYNLINVEEFNFCPFSII